MSDPRFAELLEKYWAVAYQQGTEGRNHDDATGAAEGAEWDLMQYVKDLAKDRDYWKVEAEGERAKVAFRDKLLESARDRALEEAAFVLECKSAYFSALPWQSGRHKEVQQRYRDDAAAIRALKEKPCPSP